MSVVHFSAFADNPLYTPKDVFFTSAIVGTYAPGHPVSSEAISERLEIKRHGEGYRFRFVNSSGAAEFQARCFRLPIQDPGESHMSFVDLTLVGKLPKGFSLPNGRHFSAAIIWGRDRAKYANQEVDIRWIQLSVPNDEWRAKYAKLASASTQQLQSALSAAYSNHQFVGGRLLYEIESSDR